MTTRFRGVPGFLLSFAWLAMNLFPSARAQNAAPAMQLPADQKAYRAALASPNVDAQIAALQAFVHDFPDSKRVSPARTKIFHLLLDAHPDRVKEIHALAKTLVDNASTGIDRGNEENTVAFDLAEALPNGVDLKSAEKWANDAVAQLTLTAYTESIRSDYEKFKIPLPPASELQQQLNQLIAADLQTLADVYFHEGKLDKATASLDRTNGFDPKAIEGEFGSILLTRGQIADAQHRDAETLDDLERAEVYGGLTAQTKPLLLKLYAQAHAGSTAGLEADIDAQYHKLIPAAFTPEPHKAPPTGRTALLELYTGSACEPCVAADLAVDGVLEAYPRSEVVALSFDQHIPEPDPLANPDTIARGNFYKINSTPHTILDGKAAALIGGGRSAAQKGYPKLAEDIDKELNTPSGVELKLNASVSPDHTIAVNATVKVADATALNKLLATADGKAPNLVLNIALVQPEVRYSGENGIRFHSMVVRSLARPAEKGFPVAIAGESQAAFTFNPAEVSRDLSKYLADFSQHNDHFGIVHFLSTDTTLSGPLAVAAWVEDPTTHQVVQAAFVPLDSATQEAAR
jgi:tetratricopeptide (TPR) repeat protein